MDQYKEKKKIVFLIDGLQMGGAERMMVPIIGLLKSDFDVRVCFLQEKDGNPTENDISDLGIPVDFLPIKFIRDLTALPRLIHYLRQHKPNLLHTQLEFADIYGNLAAKILGLPCVSTFHTIPNPPEKIKLRLHQWLWWNTLKLFCNKVISVAENAREYYIDVFGINPEKVITIYNGINISHFGSIHENEQTSLRRDLNIPNGAILLLTVAMLRPLKGIQYMIRALPEILADYPTICYLVVGSGPHLQALKDQAKALDIEKNIFFVGLRKDVPNILSISEIFVLPSLTEALPTVLAEAMAARKPIIASAVGGVPEMVFEGRNGLLITPGDTSQLANACIQLLKESDRRKEMGLLGWEIANQKFNIYKQIEQLKSLYINLINNYERPN